MKRRLFLLILVAFLALCPQMALADAGTPLMWATGLHLVLGNLAIGVGEGLLLAFLFKRPKPRCVTIMIAANYFSTWIGGVWLVSGIATKLDWNFYNAWRLFWCFVLGSYLMTLLLEWPFVGLCFWKQKLWLKRSIAASLVVQTASYICMFGWYWAASGKSLYTQMHIVPLSEIRLPTNLQLYYIAAQDGHVYKDAEEIGNVVSKSDRDRLIIVNVPEQNNSRALMLRVDSNEDDMVRLISVRSNLVGAAAALEPIDENNKKGRGTLFNFGRALRVNLNPASDWMFETGFWPVEGMVAENQKDGQKFHFAWETPFSQWEIRNAIQLPDDHVIFQLGNNQICVLEPQTKKIALIVQGRGPAVTMR